MKHAVEGMPSFSLTGSPAGRFLSLEDRRPRMRVGEDANGSSTCINGPRMVNTLIRRHGAHMRDTGMHIVYNTSPGGPGYPPRSPRGRSALQHRSPPCRQRTSCSSGQLIPGTRSRAHLVAHWTSMERAGEARSRLRRGAWAGRRDKGAATQKGTTGREGSAPTGLRASKFRAKLRIGPAVDSRTRRHHQNDEDHGMFQTVPFEKRDCHGIRGSLLRGAWTTGPLSNVWTSSCAYQLF
jgi:hypothetical protein